MKTLPLILLVIPWSILGSCADPPVSRAERLSYEVHIGMSEADVTEAIGHPNEIKQEPGGGVTVWTYGESRGGFLRGTRRLILRFRQGVVEKVELLPKKDPPGERALIQDVD